MSNIVKEWCASAEGATAKAPRSAKLQKTRVRYTSGAFIEIMSPGSFLKPPSIVFDCVAGHKPTQHERRHSKPSVWNRTPRRGIYPIRPPVRGAPFPRG